MQSFIRGIKQEHSKLNVKETEERVKTAAVKLGSWNVTFLYAFYIRHCIFERFVDYYIP